MIEFKREISVSALVQILGYLFMLIYFSASLQANQTYLKQRVDGLERQIESINGRFDSFILAHK